MAHGGTVFLDEVGEMSAAMQVSLLRVLQEGEIRPLGSNEIKKVDVRVISATNRSLRQEVENGTFREDLFYRLSVFVLQVPPLRKRDGDIPILANHFVHKFNKKMKRTIRGLTSSAMESLRGYSFPGNVRELENEIERAMVLAEDGDFIDTAHISQRVSANSLPNECPPAAMGSLKDQVESLERKLLLKSLEEYNGNRTRMAEKLGLSRFGLMKKMKRYGLQ
jgi:transcriptional regulator with PAS, ATPase and Fis domain